MVSLASTAATRASACATSSSKPAPQKFSQWRGKSLIDISFLQGRVHAYRRIGVIGGIQLLLIVQLRQRPVGGRQTLGLEEALTEQDGNRPLCPHGILVAHLAKHAIEV